MGLYKSFVHRVVSLVANRLYMLACVYIELECNELFSYLNKMIALLQQGYSNL